MIGLAVGSLEARRTVPRLSSVSRHGESQTPCASGSRVPSSTICSGTAWNWMSGATAPAPTRAKPPASAKFEANGPVCVGFVALQRLRLEREQQALGLGSGPHELRRRVVAEVLTDRGLVEQHLDFAHRQVLGLAEP